MIGISCVSWINAKLTRAYFSAFSPSPDASHILPRFASPSLIAALAGTDEATRIVLEKQCGETIVVDHDPPSWTWPSR